jgi:hypothetical protein
MSSTAKPPSILIIVILYFIVAAVFAVGAIICFLPGTAPGPTMANDIWTNNVITFPIIGDNIERLLGGLFLGNIPLWGTLAIVIVVVVILDIVLLLKLNNLGRILAILIALPLIVIIIGLWIIWSLFKDDVKQAFNVT